MNEHIICPFNKTDCKNMEIDPEYLDREGQPSMMCMWAYCDFCEEESYYQVIEK